MLILHANWSDGSLHLWSESLALYKRLRDTGQSTSDAQPVASTSAAAHAAGQPTAAATLPRERGISRRHVQDDQELHPFAESPERLKSALMAHLRELAQDDQKWLEAADASTVRLLLPQVDAAPMPSDRLCAAAGDMGISPEPLLESVTVSSLSLQRQSTLATLLLLEDAGPSDGMLFGHDLQYVFKVARFTLELLADQRFVPTLLRPQDGPLQARWVAWLNDEQTRQAASMLIAAMPAVLRAAVTSGAVGQGGSESNGSSAGAVFTDMVQTLTDATVRAALDAESYIDAIEGRNGAEDEHVAWLSGLLGLQKTVPSESMAATELMHDVAQWIGRLAEAGRSRGVRLVFQLHEPDTDATRQATDAIVAGDDGDSSWLLSLHAQPMDDPDRLIGLEHIWQQSGLRGKTTSDRTDRPQDSILKDLAQAARIFPPLEEALSAAVPQSLSLTTAQAYSFLREVRPILEEAGFGVIVPPWWGRAAGRLNARLVIEPLHEPGDSFDDDDDLAALLSDDHQAASAVTPSGRPLLGLDALVSFRWQIAVGDQTLSPDELEQLRESRQPLLNLRGQWVEIRPDDLHEALSFLDREGIGRATLRDAVRLLLGQEEHRPNLPLTDVQAEGWIGDVFEASTDFRRMPRLDQPQGFHGDLRPYQQTGLSWLAFLDGFGLGACLADDMGLGKTIQLLALLQHERENRDQYPVIGPTLLIVPTSLIANWQREIARFTPQLSAHVQHGPDRPDVDSFAEFAAEHDVVITTYGLIARDRDMFTDVDWHRVVLDEAQYIKNRTTRQTAAIRGLRASHRVALTGTPLENRLTELWSIMEFCNPGYLASAHDFRRRFSVPIERHRDQQQAQRLKQIVQPFILRRLKTDPDVIADLPDLLETKEFATLTAEQASLYQQQVDTMLGAVDSAEGMQRRGLVLAGLIKLKQVCNHPSLFLKESANNGTAASVAANGSSQPIQSHRSGKCRRLLVMLEEIIAAGDKALVFTQFRQMGHLLAAMIQHELDCETLFLHGGTTPKKRQKLIDRFQSDDQRAPVFILSLKAGGVGLNLTAANHVFHFDRWWNPAVEKQATDRAFRIGQLRNVQVHKFVCSGTLEEHIDHLLEQKTALAENIIGSGEQWLTELSGHQLRDMLLLRTDAVESEDDQ